MFSYVNYPCLAPNSDVAFFPSSFRCRAVQSPRDRMGGQAWPGIRAVAQEAPKAKRQETQGRGGPSRSGP